MPKMKTNSGAAKRFRRTANGYKHKQVNRNHIQTKKAQKRKRKKGDGQEAAVAVVSPEDSAYFKPRPWR